VQPTNPSRLIGAFHPADKWLEIGRSEGLCGAEKPAARDVSVSSIVAAEELVREVLAR
jgi:hypothetical protein